MGSGGRPGAPGGGRDRASADPTAPTAPTTDPATTYIVQGTGIVFSVQSLQDLWIISSELKLGETYTLTDGENDITWTQSSVAVQIQ